MSAARPKRDKRVTINNNDTSNPTINDSDPAHSPYCRDDLSASGSPPPLTPPRQNSGSHIRGILRRDRSSIAVATSDESAALLSAVSYASYAATGEQPPLVRPSLTAPAALDPAQMTDYLAPGSPLATLRTGSRTTVSAGQLTPVASYDDLTNLPPFPPIAQSATAYDDTSTDKPADPDQTTPLLAASSAPAASTPPIPKPPRTWGQYFVSLDWLVPPISTSGAIGTAINATDMLTNGKPEAILDPDWWIEMGFWLAVASLALGVNSLAANIPTNNNFLRNVARRLATFRQRSPSNNALSIFFGVFAAIAATAVTLEGLAGIPIVFLVAVFTIASGMINLASRTFGFGKLTDYLYYHTIERPYSLFRELKEPSAYYLQAQSISLLRRLKPEYVQYLYYAEAVKAQLDIAISAGRSELNSDDWEQVLVAVMNNLHAIHRRHGGSIFNPREACDLLTSGIIELGKHGVALLISSGAYVVFTNKTNHGIDYILRGITKKTSEEQGVEDLLPYWIQFTLASIGGTASMALYHIYAAAHPQCLKESIQFLNNIKDPAERRKQTLRFARDYAVAFFSGAAMAYASYNALAPNVLKKDGTYSNPYNLFPEATQIASFFLAAFVGIGAGLCVNGPGACLSHYRETPDDHINPDHQQLVTYFDNPFFNLLATAEAREGLMANSLLCAHRPAPSPMAATATAAAVAAADPSGTTANDWNNDWDNNDSDDNDSTSSPHPLPHRSASGILSQGRRSP